jgi:hypothetical protein
MRHALRFGGALALGVAIYRLVGFHDHGYWVPLTILFVFKPAVGQTSERIAMRAAGTVIGLVLATALAEVLSDAVIPSTIVLTIAAALSFALLAIEYALFTTAITVYVVLLTDTLGSSAFDSAGERALGTAVGILVAALAFRVFGETERGGCGRECVRRARWRVPSPTTPPRSHARSSLVQGASRSARTGPAHLRLSARPEATLMAWPVNRAGSRLGSAT